MADKQLPEGVKDEYVLMFDKDGNRTEDPKAAVQAEAVRVFKDGTSEHTIMRPGAQP
jgi:hypothetical protein